MSKRELVLSGQIPIAQVLKNSLVRDELSNPQVYTQKLDDLLLEGAFGNGEKRGLEPLLHCLRKIDYRISHGSKVKAFGIYSCFHEFRLLLKL